MNRDTFESEPLPEVDYELEELAEFVIDSIEVYIEHGLEQSIDPDCIIERFPEGFVW